MFNKRMTGLLKLALVMCLWLMLAERGRVTGMSLVRIMDDDDDRSMVDDSLSTTETAAQNRLILNGEPSASTLLESALKDLTLVNSAEETMTNDNVNLKQVDFDSLQAPIVASTPTNEPMARFNEQDNGELALTFATSSPPTAAIVHNYQPVKSKKKYLLMSTDSNSNTNNAMRKKLNKNHPRRFKTNTNNNNNGNQANANNNGNIKKIFKLDRSLQRVEKKSWNAPVQSISAYLEILNHSQSSQNKVSGIRNLLSSFNNS